MLQQNPGSISGSGGAGKAGRLDSAKKRGARATPQKPEEKKQAVPP